MPGQSRPDRHGSIAELDHLRPWDYERFSHELVTTLQSEERGRYAVWYKLNDGKELLYTPPRCNTKPKRWMDPTARTMMRLEDDWPALQIYSLQLGGRFAPSALLRLDA